MKIIYVRAGIIPEYYNNRFRLGNIFLNRVKNRILAVGSEFLLNYKYRIIDMFFEASLRNVGDVHEVNAREISSIDASEFDVMVIHHRYDGYVSHAKHDESRLIKMAKKHSGCRVLYINDDIPESMYSDEVLDCFDVVVKREPFRDVTRYNLSDANRAKIVPTLLGCEIFSLIKVLNLRVTRLAARRLSYQGPLKNDLFFLGKATDERRELWQSVCVDFRCGGGLLPRIGRELEPEFVGQKLSYGKYLDEMSKSKICLATGGHGPFTFRHLEALALGRFLLCDAKIRELALPLPLEEDKHYAVYADSNDLVRKVKWYLEHDEQRESIAKAGKQLFEQNYLPQVHGMFLREKFAGKISLMSGR